ncbi:unnamed protein product [Brachionus calyciflorus]|uniref:Uncharacterized protein n=1 Tax=Brachionus calyciflorus TaxID=104777 RepID=A0A814BL93_9BILA|nr:unnamed protein product [Brachionus calyciflorus]
MNEAKFKIIDYYDSIKNQVDILTENLIIKLDLTESRANEFNLIRQVIIEKIQEIFYLNFEYLKLNESKVFSTTDPKELYLPKFCFLINNNLNDLCKIIITKEYVPDAVRLALKSGQIIKRLSKKDTIFYSLLINLIEKSCKSEYIIDLSVSNDTLIENLSICVSEPLLPDDFLVVDGLKSRQMLQNLNVYFFNKQIIYSNVFSSLKWLQKLTIILSDNTIFEPQCFEGLENLIELSITNKNNREVMTLSTLNNLINLKKIKFNCSILKSFESNEIENLKNLNYMSIRYGQFMDNLRPDSLKPIEKLTILDLAFTLISPEIFNQPNYFQHLKYLNVRGYLSSDLKIEGINLLKNLEYLNIIDSSVYPGFDNNLLEHEKLNLPKLKYLAISKKYIPVFELLDLKYLRLDGLNEFNQDLLLKQTHLVGLSLTMNEDFFKQLGKNNFDKLTNLIHIQFSIRNVNRHRNLNKEIYKSFLHRDNVFILDQTDDHNSFSVSIYQSLDDMIDKEICFSSEIKEPIMDRLDGYWEF